MGKPSDLIQGTLDLLILRSIATRPLHGWAIAKRIQTVSREVLQVQQGSLYPALHRLEQQGYIEGVTRETEGGRTSRVYSLTSFGQEQLGKETGQWERLSAAVRLVLEEA